MKSNNRSIEDRGSPLADEPKMLRGYGYFRNHGYAFYYLIIAIPAILALSILTGPFQVPDETAHFYRAIQLSHGHIKPIVSPAGDAAGGDIEQGASVLSPHFRDPSRSLETGHRFALPDVLQTAHAPSSPGAHFTAFSNTAIYFPMAHAVPALAIACARASGTSPLIWMYAGRLANGLVAIAVSAMAIALFEESGLFPMVICTLPMTLFEAASLSADALVIPFSVMIAALLARLARGREVRWREYVLLALCLLIVCVGKFAYVPLAALPPVVAALQKQRRSTVFGLSALTVLAVAIWGAWTGVVRHDVFSIRDAGMHISVDEQLHHVLSQPLAFGATFFMSLKHDSVTLIEELVGSNLGWLDLKLPKLQVAILLANLLVALILNPAVTALKSLSRVAVALFAGGSFVAACLLLYLQYTPVGQPLIDGVQGRYLLPLLPLVALMIPNFMPNLSWRSRAASVVMCVSGACAFATIGCVWAFYWR